MKLNENQKVTLTLGQLKKLVKEGKLIKESVGIKGLDDITHKLDALKASMKDVNPDYLELNYSNNSIEEFSLDDIDDDMLIAVINGNMRVFALEVVDEGAVLVAATSKAALKNGLYFRYKELYTDAADYAWDALEPQEAAYRELTFGGQYRSPSPKGDWKDGLDDSFYDRVCRVF